MVEQNMEISRDFINTTILAMEELMSKAKTVREQKLIYTMTLIMKECLKFEEGEKNHG